MTDTILNITEFIASLCALLFFVFILVALVVLAGYIVLATILNIILWIRSKKSVEKLLILTE